jgi:hypothetical protein
VERSPHTDEPTGGSRAFGLLEHDVVAGFEDARQPGRIDVALRDEPRHPRKEA